MKRVFIVTPVLLLLLSFVFGCGKSYPSGFATVSNEPPPDILSATNLAQWLSLIKDLKPTQGLQNYWDTPRFRRGTPPVLIRYNGQSILFKAEAITVTTVHKTTNFMEAEIYSLPMTVVETHALGLSLCNMFGFETNKFSAWRDTVGDKWLDMPLINVGDRRHFFRVLRTFSDEKPWYIIFVIQDENALADMVHRPPRNTN